LAEEEGTALNESQSKSVLAALKNLQGHGCPIELPRN